MPRFQQIKNFAAMVFRYVVSGFAGIGANLAVFSLLVVHLEVWYVFASCIGFIAAYGVTFLMHKYWTFKSLSPELFYKQSVVYFFSAVATLVINTAFLYVLVDYVSVHPVLAQFVSLLFAAALSFLFTTQVTFHAQSSRIHKLTKFFNFGLCKFVTKEKKWFLTLLLVSLILMCARVVFLPLTFSTDSVTYVATAEHLWGDADAAVYGERILKPLAPYIVGLLSQVGIAPATALLVQAYILYVALAFAVYWFGYELFRRSDYAFTTALIVITSYPILRYGLDYMTETGVWTFYFAALAATVHWIREPSFRWIVVISIFFLAGLLWKEYIVLAGLIFFLGIVTHRDLSWKSKLMTVVQTGLLVLLPWVMWQYAVYVQYDYTYLNWLAIGSASSAYEAEYTIFKISKTLFALLFGVWLLVLWGFYKIGTVADSVRRMLWLMLIPSLGFLLWGYVSSRLFFSLVPLLAPVAAIGFMELPSKHYRIAAVLLIGIINGILIALAFDPSIRSLINQSTHGI